MPIWLIATGAPNWYVNKLAAELSNKGDDKLFKTLSLLIPEEELKPELKSIKGYWCGHCFRTTKSKRDTGGCGRRNT